MPSQTFGKSHFAPPPLLATFSICISRQLLLQTTAVVIAAALVQVLSKEESPQMKTSQFFLLFNGLAVWDQVQQVSYLQCGTKPSRLATGPSLAGQLPLVWNQAQQVSYWTKPSRLAAFSVGPKPSRLAAFSVGPSLACQLLDQAQQVSCLQCGTKPSRLVTLGWDQAQLVAAAISGQLHLVWDLAQQVSYLRVDQAQLVAAAISGQLPLVWDHLALGKLIVFYQPQYLIIKTFLVKSQ